MIPAVRFGRHLALPFVIFFLASASRDTRAAAVPPAANCPQFTCKAVYSSWSYLNGAPYAYKQAGAANNSDHALAPISSTTSNEDAPTQANNKMDIWVYPTCDPMCAADANGNWPSPQEVSPTGAKLMVLANENRLKCTALANGGNNKVATPKYDNESNPTIGPPMTKQNSGN